MKKSLVLFIIFVIVLVLSKMVYSEYCKSNPTECQEEKVDYENDGFPQKGIDW